MRRCTCRDLKDAALFRPWFWIVFLLVSLAAGCAEKAAMVPKGSLPPAAEIAPMGFSIQVGAFVDLDKAVRLVNSLEGEGIVAYYFRHDSELFKVRFGNFPSKESAVKEAESLLSSRIIEEYYVVGPEDYAAAKARVYGRGNLRDELVRTSESFVGLPYRWGGASLEQGFDCSGLTMAVYRLNGLDLPRSSREQYLLGAPIKREELEKGDLVFFSLSGDRKVSHVGLFAGDNRFIHAPGKGKTIRADSLSDVYYDSRYAGARRYVR
jgi:cell wall-associated NlpC family hydrolase